MAHDLFISYSSKDKTTADAVCARMETGGIRCWYAPRDIEPGADWAESIIQAIDRSRIMVLIFTKDSNISKQVLREINYAVGAGVTIIPLRLTKEDPVPSMKYYLSAVHWIDALDCELEGKIEELYQTCRAVINTKPVDVVPVQGSGSTGRAKKKTGLIIGIAVVAVAAIVLAVFLGEKQRTPAEPSLTQNETGSGDVISEEKTDDQTAAKADILPGSTIHLADPNPGFPIGSLSDSAGKELPTAGAGNALINFYNRGYAAYDDGWFYYRGNDDGRLYKVREDGSERIKLSDRSAYCITVYDGYVYFICGDAEEPGIFRTDLNGTNETKLWYNEEQHIFIKNNTLYFCSVSDVYSLDLGEVNEDFDCNNLIGDEICLGSFPDDEWPFEWCFGEDYIYYVRFDNNYLCRTQYDVSDPEILLDHAVSDLTLRGGILYFCDNDMDCMKVFEEESEKFSVLLEGGSYPEMNITGDGIYCLDPDARLICFDPTTGEAVMLYDSACSYIYVGGNKIFYCDGRDYLLMDRTDKNSIVIDEG